MQNSSEALQVYPKGSCRKSTLKPPWIDRGVCYLLVVTRSLMEKLFSKSRYCAFEFKNVIKNERRLFCLEPVCIFWNKTSKVTAFPFIQSPQLNVNTKYQSQVNIHLRYSKFNSKRHEQTSCSPIAGSYFSAFVCLQSYLFF